VVENLVDYHCHILPGLDDGAKDLDQALAMARQLADAGFSVVHCTPHCMKGVFDNSAAGVRAAVADLQRAIDAAGILLQLRAGMEYYLDEYFSKQLDDPLPLGDTRYLLFEIPSSASPARVRDGIFEIGRRGFVPLLAHPERLALCLAEVPGKSFLRKILAGLPGVPTPGEGFSALASFRDMGCCFQGNLGSFGGFYGRDVLKAAESIHNGGLYDVMGTDGHDPRGLERILRTLTLMKAG